MFPLQRRYRNVRRYREISQVLLRHGLGSIVDLLGLEPYFALPRRIIGRAQHIERVTTGARIRMALEELGPTFIKLGQILSTRPDVVPPDVIPELAKLQDEVPPAPWEAVQETIETELGRSLEDLFEYVDTRPLAAASLGQVHAARLHTGEHVVVKVQRPNIERIIHVDLDILADLATLASQRTSLGTLYDLPTIVEDFAYTLRTELDYRREGRNCERFTAQYAEDPFIRFPKVYWGYSSRRVLTLEQMYGIKIDDLAALDAAGHSRPRLARHGARIMVRGVFEFGFFHADPHPGNFFVQPDGVIAVVDFGMVGHIKQDDQLRLARLFVAAVRHDPHTMVEALMAMNSITRSADRETLERDSDRLLDKYDNAPLSDLTARELFDDILPVAFRHRIRLPSHYWLLAKTLVMMEGLASRLDPTFRVMVEARPEVVKLAARLSSPEAVLNRTASNVSHWAELARSVPEMIPRLLDKAEAGRMEVQARMPEIPRAVHQLDRIANRLAITMLVSAFIVAMALLLPNFAPPALRGLSGWIIVIGLLIASIMGLWLLFEIWRSGRHRM